MDYSNTPEFSIEIIPIKSFAKFAAKHLWLSSLLLRMQDVCMQLFLNNDSVVYIFASIL